MDERFEREYLDTRDFAFEEEELEDNKEEIVEEAEPIFRDYMDSRDFAFEEEIEEDRVITSDDDNKQLMNEEKERIELEIEKFKNTSEKITRDLNKIKVNLSLDNKININNEIEDASRELKELVEMSDSIIEVIDRLRLFANETDFSMSVSEIKKTVKELKDRLKNLKILQVEKYNARVDYINKEIEELKKLNDVDLDILEMINSLDIISRCDNSINDWRAVNYLKNIDYNKLIDTNKLINEIKDKLNIRKEAIEIEALEIDINNIENEINRIENDLEDINKVKENLVIVGNLINDFRVKLENSKDKISLDEYNNYLDRINDLEANLSDVNNIIKEKINYKNNYDRLLSDVNDLSIDVDQFKVDVDSFFGFIVSDGINVFISKFNRLSNGINNLKEKILKEYNDGLIDNNQYNTLNSKITEMEKKLSDSNDKLMDPGMIKDADIYGVLNGDIDGLEEALSKLEEQVNLLEKPIKDRTVRKQIDMIVKQLDSEIKRIEKLLLQYKDKDIDKYNQTVERLNNVKDRLNKVNKDYTKKCPLMVCKVKEAKSLYKKYKKQILIAAGVAAFALTSHHVLIPAIMHGNIMIAGTSPVLRPTAKFINSLLGGVVGAVKDVSGAWKLANGVIINPSVAATSLLKGLAVSGIGTTALVAPVVVAIKKLVDKMKTVELKQKLTEGKEKAQEKIAKGKNAAEEKIKQQKEKLTNKYEPKYERKKEKKTKKVNNTKVGIATEEEFINLFRDYRKSGKTLEEFCEEEELTDSEVEMLKLFDARYQENISQNKKGR